MKTSYPEDWPQFFTATIREWKPLLESNAHKDIIIQSLQFLVSDKMISLNAFVIMENHLHLIWQAMNGHTLKNIQQSFLRFTSQKIKFELLENNPVMLEDYKVNSFNRGYNFWKRRSLGVELFSLEVFNQKMNYIHNNPVKAGICKYPEQYYYSSANYYHSGVDEFGMITRYE